MLQIVFADQCNIQRDTVMVRFNFIPKMGKARYSFLNSCFDFLNFAISLL